MKGELCQESAGLCRINGRPVAYWGYRRGGRSRPYLLQASPKAAARPVHARLPLTKGDSSKELHGVGGLTHEHMIHRRENLWFIL